MGPDPSLLSHVPLLSGYVEPKTLSYQINLFNPTGADVKPDGAEGAYIIADMPRPKECHQFKLTH